MRKTATWANIVINANTEESVALNMQLTYMVIATSSSGKMFV